MVLQTFFNKISLNDNQEMWLNDIDDLNVRKQRWDFLYERSKSYFKSITSHETSPAVRIAMKNEIVSQLCIKLSRRSALLNQSSCLIKNAINFSPEPNLLLLQHAENLFNQNKTIIKIKVGITFEQF